LEAPGIAHLHPIASGEQQPNDALQRQFESFLQLVIAMNITAPNSRTWRLWQVRTCIARSVMVLFVAAATATAQSSRSCLPPDSTSAALQRFALKVGSDTSRFALAVRSKYTIPASAPSQVSLLQDSTVCEQVTAAIDSGATTPPAEALVVVRLGESSPFYLATPRRTGVMGSVYLLNSQFVVLASFETG
jgi:hypothetical protein